MRDRTRLGNVQLRSLVFSLLVGVVGVVPLVMGGCSATERGDTSSAWYNKSYLKSIFGDFDHTQQVILPPSPENEQLLARGAALAEGSAACGACHGSRPGDPTSPLSGGRPMRDRFGLVAAANITPDKETGIGNWNLFEIMRAIRASIDREGRPISLDLHQGYRWMSDRDAKALSLYLLSLPPVSHPVERRVLGGFERNKWGLFPQHSDLAGYVPALHEEVSAVRGKYLAQNVSQCAMCHSSTVGEFRGYANEGGVLAVFREVARMILGDGEKYDESVAEYLSPEGKKKYEAEILARDAASRGVEAPASKEALVSDIYETALTTGEYPVGGPDIRGGSQDGGLASWSESDIVQYLSHGTTPKGEVREKRFCPWPYFSAMSESDKQSIAKYLKKL